MTAQADSLPADDKILDTEYEARNTFHDSRSTPLDLSVVIVNWNVCGLLRDCLYSILDAALPDAHLANIWHLRPDGLRFEILVIDSASSIQYITSHPLCKVRYVQTIIPHFPAHSIVAEGNPLGFWSTKKAEPVKNRSAWETNQYLYKKRIGWGCCLPRYKNK